MKQQTEIKEIYETQNNRRYKSIKQWLFKKGTPKTISETERKWNEIKVEKFREATFYLDQERGDKRALSRQS